MLHVCQNLLLSGVPVGEHTLVLVRAIHQVGAGANVGRVLALGDELEVQLVPARGDAIGSAILGTLDAAAGGAGGSGVADGGVPLVAAVAVCGSGDLVCPAPVRVDGDRGRHRRAVTSRCAPGPLQRGVALSRETAHLLGRGRCHKGSKGGELGIHGEELAEPGWDRRQVND